MSPLQLTVGMAAVVASLAASAEGLTEAYVAARHFDGTYLAAGHELQAVRQSLPIARASLRPNVALSASTSNVTGTREFPNSLNQSVRVPLDYSSPQASLQLRQPLFNQDAMVRLRQAGTQIESAEATFEVRQLNLVERVVMAYLQALLANDAVGFAEAEVALTESQLTRARQRFERGEGTRTEVSQAESGLGMAQVRRIEALDALRVAQQGLRRLTGTDMVRLRATSPQLTSMVPPLRPLTEWLEVADRDNPGLKARRLGIDVAQLSIDRNRAAHLPRLDLVASLSRSQSESISSLNQTSTLRSLGVQLSVPIYSGGGIEATVRQSVSERDRAVEELRAEREAVLVDVQRYWSNLANGLKRIESYARVVATSEVALDGVSRAQAVGLATLTDVLDAQTRRFAALRELAQARAEYVAARMRLLTLAGQPADEIVADVDKLLTDEQPLRLQPQP